MDSATTKHQASAAAEHPALDVEVTREPQSQAVLRITMPPEEISNAVSAAHQRLAQRYIVPGFRRGKAPRALLERHIGRESLMDEALSILVGRGFHLAVEQTGLEPVGRPEIDAKLEDLQEGSPLTFTATVEVFPEVDPGDYRGVRVARGESAVAEESVEEAIGDLRLRHASLASAGDEPAQRGDFALVQIVESAAGLPRLQAGKEYLVEIGGGVHPSEFEEALAGVRRGERREIALGNTGERLTVVAVDVKRRELPALDDSFARQFGDESLEALEGRVRAQKGGEAAQRAVAAYETAVLRAVVDGSTVDLPRNLVAHEVEHLLGDFVESLGKRGLTLESYLRSAEKTEEAMRAELDEIARRRLSLQLVVEEIARREGVEPTEEEIDAEVENLAQSFELDAARVREWLGEERRRDALINSLRRRKTVRFLVGLASGKGES